MESFGYAIFIEIAGSLAYDLLKRGAYRLPGKGIGSAEKEALLRAYQHAFKVMLERTAAGLSPNIQAHLGDLLEHFFQDESVSDLLLDLALEKNALLDKQITLTTLRARLESIGCDPQTFPLDLDTALISLVYGLGEGLQQESVPLFKQISLSLLKATPARIFEHAKKIANEARQKDLQNYLAAMRAYCAQLPYISLRGKPRPHLSDIYIQQRTVNYRSEQDQSQANHPKRYEPRVKSVQQAIKQHRHLLIEAGPGMGKSTALNYLALRLIDASVQDEAEILLPIRISARSFASRQGSFASALHAQVSEELGITLDKDLPLGFFAEPPFPGAIWLVLFDGLDEIVHQKTRQQLVDNIRHRARRADSFYRFIITTRPLTETSEFIEEDFGHYVLRPLAPKQLSTFAQKWFSTSRGALADDATRFLSQLKESRVVDLTRIPLLLTMSAIVYEQDKYAHLPANRVGLYRRFASVLLEDEETTRETRAAFCDEWQSRLGRKGLNWADDLFDARLQLLKHLALWRQEGNAGALNNEAIRYLREGNFLPEDVDEVWLCQQVETLLQRTGLVVLRGNDHVFIHDTFREYLAAEAIAHKYKPFTKGVWPLIRDWVNAGWYEVVLHLLAAWSMAGEDVTRLLYRIWKSGEGNLHLAGRALSEGVRLTGDLDKDLVNALLLAVEQSHHLTGHSDYCPTALDILGTLRGRDDVAAGLLALVKGKRGKWPTEHIIMTLVRLDLIDDLPSFIRELGVGWWVLPLTHRLQDVGRTDDARQVLLSVAQDDNVMPDIRMRAAKGLGWAGWPDEASSILLKVAPLIDFDVCQEEITDFLESYNRVDELRFIAVGPSMYGRLRRYATNALSRLGEEYDNNLVTRLVVSDERSEFWLCLYAAQELAEQGDTDEVSEMLVSLAQSHNSEPRNRISVAEALIKLDYVIKAVEVLSNILIDPSIPPKYQINAAKMLGAHGQVEKAAATLLSLVNNEDVEPAHRIGAARILAELGDTSNSIQVLTSFACNNRLQLEDRISAAKLLSELGRVDEATNILLEAAAEKLSNTQDFFLITQALIDIGRAETAANVLLNLSRDSSTSPRDLLRTAEELIKLSYIDEVTDILLNLTDDEDAPLSVRFKAAEILEVNNRMNDGDFTSLLLSLAREVKAGSEFDRGVARQLTQRLQELIGVKGLISISQDLGVNGRVRYHAALTLRRRKHFEEAYAVLLSVARDEGLDEYVRRNAIDRLEYDGRVQEMLALLRDSTVRAWVRLWAADALRTNWFRDTTPNKYELADEVSSILSMLIHSASGEDTWVRSSAISSLTLDNRAAELLALARDQTLAKDLRQQCISNIEKLNKGRVLTKLDLATLTHLAEEETEPEIRSAIQQIISNLTQRLQIDEEDSLLLYEAPIDVIASPALPKEE